MVARISCFGVSWGFWAFLELCPVMAWGGGCRQVRLCVSITSGNPLKNQSWGQRAAPSAAPSSPLGCRTVPSSVLESCTHPSPLLAPSTASFGLVLQALATCPALPSGEGMSPCCWRCSHTQPQPLPQLLFSPFLPFVSFLFYFFSLSPSKPPQASSDIPLQTIYSPTPIAPSQPSAPAFLSWLSVWVVGTKPGHAKPRSVPFHTFDSSFPSSPVQT